MNHGWKNKNWNEVIEIFNGKNQKAVENPNGQYPIYGSGGIMSYADSYLCPENCTIIGRKGNINNPIFVPTKFWNVDTAFGLCPNDLLQPRYLYYFCQIYDFGKHNKATTIPSLVKNDLLKISMPVPPMETQVQIVSELDKLNELIELKRSQLKDLDTLAQSLFYETFGDPIENPKGWETKPFGKLIRLKSGDALSAKNFCDGIYPVYGGNGIAGYHNKYNISGPNIIIGRVGALCGNVRLIDADIFVTDNAFIVNLQQDMNLRFLERLLTLLELRKYANAAAQPVISNTSLKVLNVPIPPISMQNEFAEKIEAIEEQKRLIESSISDLETLLASRMDYWFND